MRNKIRTRKIAQLMYKVQFSFLIGRIKISLKFVCLTKIENIAKSKDIIKM